MRKSFFVESRETFVARARTIWFAWAPRFRKWSQ